MPNKEGSRKTILSVDDDKYALELIKECLGQRGHKVLTASSSNEAIKLIEKTNINNIDLVLLDVNLPEEDGISLSKKIENYNPYMPIIFLSGVVDKRLGGLENFVIKPFDTEKLMQKIENITNLMGIRKLNLYETSKVKRFFYDHLASPAFLAIYDSNIDRCLHPDKCKLEVASLKFKETFGVSDNDIKGKWLDEMLDIAGLNGAERKHFYESLIKDKEVKRMEFKSHTKNDYCAISSRFTELENISSFYGLQGQIADISKVKLSQFKEKLESLMHHELTELADATNTLNLEEITNSSFELLLKMFKAEFGSMYLYDKNLDHLSLVKDNHLIKKENKKYDKNKTVLMECIRKGEPIIAMEKEDIPQGIILQTDSKYKNKFISIPLKIGKDAPKENETETTRLIGIINLANISTDNIAEETGFNKDILSKENYKSLIKENFKIKAKLISRIIAQTISDAQFYDYQKELANIDYLTQLSVHRYFQTELEKEFNRQKKSGKSLSLLMIDIDKFKDINDQYGHQIGDKILGFMGQRIKENLRITDFGARYGGEEFAVILPETNFAGGYTFGEKLRKKIESCDYKGAGLPKVTISLGLATAPYYAIKSKYDLIKIADQNLYKAKNSGRNTTRPIPLEKVV